jgi:hypothetical protein
MITKTYSKTLFFSHLCKALAAVYGAVLTWLKWNLCLFTAGSASSSVHLAFWFGSVFACIAAALASLRLVHKAFGCVELLLASGENKFSATFFTDESLVFVHFDLPRFWNIRYLPLDGFAPPPLIYQRSNLSYRGIWDICSQGRIPEFAAYPLNGVIHRFRRNPHFTGNIRIGTATKIQKQHLLFHLGKALSDPVIYNL